MKSKKLLWQGIRLPTWNANRLYELFTVVNEGFADREKEGEYARMLMVLISAFMGRNGGWMNSLRAKRLDPEEVAADILLHILTKTPEITMDTPCAPVLLAILNRTMSNQAIVAMRRNRIVPEPLPASDWSGADDQSGVPYYDRGDEAPAGALSAFLRSAEEQACRGNWPDQIGVCVLYRYLTRRLLKEHQIIPHALLPTSLRRRVHVECHAVVSFRLNRLVRTFAAGL